MDLLIQLISNAAETSAVQWFGRHENTSSGVVTVEGRVYRISIDDLGPEPPAAGSEIAV